MIRKLFLFLSFFIPALIFGISFFWKGILWFFVIIAPFILLGIYDLLQKKHALLRIYPIIGHGRYLMEELRPEIQQYFVEDNINGQPISREFRSIIYQRAKGDLDTQAFGSQRDVYEDGYEWMCHSLVPKKLSPEEGRTQIGNHQCSKPYLSSRLNISAMSFGSIGKNATLALNKGAKMGNFAHNTGEGGIAPYHLKYQGDLIWQIGTGYFGCRTNDGKFDSEQFKEKANLPQVKMIELKLSQGAKPSHGGLLPAIKVTKEIAEIRGVPLGKDVLSPATHSTFKNPIGLLEFLQTLRDFSGGKPVGFKLCLGEMKEFFCICKAMIETKIIPDFITVDGAEGGTGAAPLEFSNFVGMPVREGLLCVHNTLMGLNLRENIQVIAAGKVFSAFHIFKMMALGANLCNSARGMMMALGCIQARRCHMNTCPTGVTSQDPARNRALDIENKSKRVARYHNETVKSFLALVGAAGLSSPNEIKPHHILRRFESQEIKRFDEFYTFFEPGCLLNPPFPDQIKISWEQASQHHF